MNSIQNKMVVVLGATATGKTGLATSIAEKYKGEIISADSRQLYKGMDLGTGKDIDEYTIDGKEIPYHLIDIVNAGYKYNVYEFQRDFLKAYETINKNNNLPVVCGGTGMYLEAVLNKYQLITVPKNEKLRTLLEQKDLDELKEILLKYKELHNNSDTETKKRAIRAIEIEDYISKNPQEKIDYPDFNTLLVGIMFSRERRRERISQRLDQRFKDGMIDEVKQLIESGVNPEDLIYYGLEYKFITNYVIGNISYKEMYEGLEIAIHQFAKRQMTWFRRMERNGAKIHWIDGEKSPEEKMKEFDNLYRSRFNI
ncbi:MAG: tRNA (adenosine(37)-N6)-dimethylallyltransferase MiaA [Marinifilaceae bacterium]|jgi:tRNA dimethylallyltransferase|nr:tRNA (adenosine(37)-N6)-dimethylallyltransferase MiaA [Marinifilaceae bacterium]